MPKRYCALGGLERPSKVELVFVPMAAFNPSLPVVVGKNVAAERLKERGVLITDGNKLGDNLTTVYRIKGKDNKPLVLQFGTGLDALVSCSIVTFVDSEREDSKRRICFVNMDENPLAGKELEDVVKVIGRQLYDGRQAYWGGRCPENLTFEQFMEKKSAIIKPNRVTNVNEAVVKCPERLSKFHLMTDLEQDEKTGKWKFTKRPISRFNTTSRAFTGLISCNLGLYTGYNKGPTWGVYINVKDALLKPVDLTSRSEFPMALGMDFGGEADETHDPVKMVIDADKGDHEEGSSDEEESHTPVSKRARV